MQARSVMVSILKMIGHGVFVLLLILKMGVLFSAMVIVRWLSNKQPNYKKIARKEKIIIDYDRI